MNSVSEYMEGISDISIAFEYYTISGLLFYYFRKSGSPQSLLWIAMCFTAFIWLCGATHFVMFLGWWYDLTTVSSVIKCLTSIVSFCTIFVLVVVYAEVEKMLKKYVELEESVRENKDKVAQLCHEVQTPLSGISGTAEILRITDPTLNPSGFERYIGNISKFSAMLSSIAYNIMRDVRREGSGEGNVKFVDLEDTVSLLGDMYCESHHYSGQELSFELSAGSPVVVKMDHTKFMQIMVNIVNNSLKFSDPSAGWVEVKLSVRTFDCIPKIDKKVYFPFVMAPPHDINSFYVYFTVEDNGVGITRQDLPGIFEKYNRSEYTSSGENLGCGIGLALCVKILKKMGGMMGVESERYFGTKIFVAMPLLGVENSSHPD